MQGAQPLRPAATGARGLRARRRRAGAAAPAAQSRGTGHHRSHVPVEPAHHCRCGSELGRLDSSLLHVAGE